MSRHDCMKLISFVNAVEMLGLLLNLNVPLLFLLIFLDFKEYVPDD